MAKNLNWKISLPVIICLSAVVAYFSAEISEAFLSKIYEDSFDISDSEFIISLIKTSIYFSVALSLIIEFVLRFGISIVGMFVGVKYLEGRKFQLKIFLDKLLILEYLIIAFKFFELLTVKLFLVESIENYKIIQSPLSLIRLFSLENNSYIFNIAAHFGLGTVIYLIFVYKSVLRKNIYETTSLVLCVSIILALNLLVGVFGI